MLFAKGMQHNQHSTAAAKFAQKWAGRGYEKGESQVFWIELLHDVLGVESPTDFISFENQVKLSNTSFIDAYIATTRVLIEQKSIDKDLRKAIPQSDGSMLTPFQQAKKYVVEMPVSKHPRWVITCNFKSFFVYDMENPQSEPEIILLENLEKEFYRLQFIVDTGNEHLKKEMEVSLQAGEIIGKIYDEFLKQYINPDDPHSLRSLNIICVRLVFCLYAEDAGIFGEKRCMFHDYLAQFKPGKGEMRKGLIDLFDVLNTPEDKRDPYLDDSLRAFPYCNGGLFAEKDIEIPRFNDALAELILKHASDDFDWSQISPTIFGAVFESTLNPETRRSGGMHYTSIENIHKVIDPLFLDELKAEIEAIETEPIEKKRIQKAKDYQDKLASLKFLDPACGSGNFLTETYLSLRRLENRALSVITKGQMYFDFGEEFSPIKVKIHQFYGIEINDFAVSTATTALWIAEAQMMIETEKLIHTNLDFLPLKAYTNIREGNALRIDWNEVVPAVELNYIMGNPPFVGHQWRSAEQKEDMDIVFSGFKTYGKLDYVASWYKKAVDYIQGGSILCAFVSTNSIVQGESVATMWEPLFSKYKLQIIFAYHTFRWDSEASLKAHVHCVIIGFTCGHYMGRKRIFLNDTQFTDADNINGYLLNAPNVFIQNRGLSLTKGMPKMSKGSQPTDGGYLILSPEERNTIVEKHPESNRFILKYVGSDDFINNKQRFCLWLENVSPNSYRHIPEIMSRLQKVSEVRKSSPTESVRRDADTPMLFSQRRQPQSRYFVIPEVSSQRRRYVPIGYLPPDIIASNKLYIVPDASEFMFGVMTSNVHMAWMRVVCGRLKSDYSYSPSVYNNFPWPSPTAAQKEKIEATAQAILDARAKYPDCSLADLYDEIAMPPELRKAHQENDKAVMTAYGFDWHTMSESDCVAELFKMYQELTKA